MKIKELGEEMEIRSTHLDRLYFVTDGIAVKIGFSRDVEGRLASMQTAQPRELGVIATIPASAQEEQEVHRHFAHLRLRGEWFTLGPEISAFISELEGVRRLIEQRRATVSDVLTGNIRRIIVTDDIPVVHREFCKWFDKRSQAGFGNSETERAATYLKLSLTALTMNKVKHPAMVVALAGDVARLESCIRRQSPECA